RFLQAEGIVLASSSLRGDRGRRIQFWPASGRARQTLLGAGQNVDLRAELQNVPPKPLPSGGTVELF
ncbi:MAG TPA: hypothetical protein VFN53_05800, partial [Acidobacteriaceae bacterium]|nr:hypothetical protein [Acidobacteriaceae bacterium]